MGHNSECDNKLKYFTQQSLLFWKKKFVLHHNTNIEQTLDVCILIKIR